MYRGFLTTRVWCLAVILPAAYLHLVCAAPDRTAMAEKKPTAGEERSPRPPPCENFPRTIDEAIMESSRGREGRVRENGMILDGDMMLTPDQYARLYGKPAPNNTAAPASASDAAAPPPTKPASDN